MSRKKDFASVLENLNKAGEQATHSSPISNQSDDDAKATQTTDKPKKSNTAKNRAVKRDHLKLLAFGEVGINEFGANKCNYRITRPIDQWIRSHTEGNKNLVFNWLLELGMKQAIKQGKDGKILVTPDDLTPLDDG